MPQPNRLFITGIPTTGKSFLGKKLANEVEGINVSIDDVREVIKNDDRFKKWVNFYWDQDEYTYYTTTNSNQQWENLVNQSEKMWPGILEYIKKYEDEEKPVIFEGVNILPHLAKKDLPFPGIILIGKSFEEVFERNKREPRWGKTEELQRMEALSFFNVERPNYKLEAEKYDYPVFEEPEEAYIKALELLK